MAGPDAGYFTLGPTVEAALYLVVSSAAPDLGVESEDILVAPEEVEVGSIKPDDLRCMTTAIFRGPVPATIIEEFRTWWAESGGGSVEIEFLTDDLTRMLPSRSAALSKLEEGQWSVRVPFVLYHHAFPETRREALALIKEAELKRD